MYKILDIKNKNSYKTRNDGAYPLRIGSIIDFIISPKIGDNAYLIYKYDKNGNLKDSVLKTSVVNNIGNSNDIITIITNNSLYVLSEF